MRYESIKEEIPEFVDFLLKFQTPDMHDQKKMARDIVKSLSEKHRTAQQIVIKILSEILKEYSNQDYDLRNQDAINYCKQVMKINNDFRYI